MERIGCKRISLIISILILFCAWMFFVPFANTAHAMTFVASRPTFGLYCSEKDIIISGNEKYDLTDTALWAKQRAVEEAEYRVSGDHEVEFMIPFMSSAMDIPQFYVTVDRQAVSGEVWYGGTSLFISNGKPENSLIKERINDISKPSLDETIVGTLYTLLPDTNTLSITIKLEKNSAYIYETTNHITSSTSADGTQTWNFMNVPANKSFQYFIIGENTVIDFSCSCEYQMQTMAYKDFIDSHYDSIEEMFKEYDEEYVTREYIYSEANKALKSGGTGLDDIFYSGNQMYLNVYKFTLPLDGEATVRYAMEAPIQRNDRFDPAIYMVEHIQLGSYHTKYSITLPDEIPYIIEASHTTEKNGEVYMANATENYYFVSCALQKPHDKQATEQPRFSKTQLAIIITCGIAGGIFFIIAIVCFVMFIREKRRNKS